MRTTATPATGAGRLLRRALLVLELCWYGAALVVAAGRAVSPPGPSGAAVGIVVGLGAVCALAAATRWWRPGWTTPVALAGLVVGLATALPTDPQPLTPLRWVLCGAILPVLLTAVLRRGNRIAALVALGLACASAALGAARGGDTVNVEVARRLAGGYPFPALVLVTGVLVLLVPVALGLLLRSTDAARSVERLARLRAEERLAVARELHDLVASHVSGMVLAAQAIGMTEPSPTARRCGQMIEEAGHRALAAMSRMVDTLRGRGLAELGPDVVHDDKLGSIRVPEDAVRAAIGEEPRVRLRTSPAVGDVAADVSAGDRSDVLVTLHRISVEALTNARRHGPSDADIEVSLSEQAPATLVLEVVNDRRTGGGTTPGGGHGLVGLGERATRVGGRVEAGPDDDGRWRLRAELPW